MTRRMKLLGLGAMLMVAAALSACGGGNETTAAAPEPAPPAEPASPAAEPPAEPATGGTTLIGTVGPGFTITLTDEAGQAVTSLPSGTYTIEVDDQASSHDFHLSGPGVDQATDVGGTGKTTWTVDLQPGDYTFVCDPHASSMNGAFTVS